MDIPSYDISLISSQVDTKSTTWRYFEWLNKDRAKYMIVLPSVPSGFTLNDLPRKVIYADPTMLLKLDDAGVLYTKAGNAPFVIRLADSSFSDSEMAVFLYLVYSKCKDTDDTDYVAQYRVSSFYSKSISLYLKDILDTIIGDLNTDAWMWSQHEVHLLWDLFAAEDFLVNARSTFVGIDKLYYLALYYFPASLYKRSKHVDVHKVRDLSVEGTDGLLTTMYFWKNNEIDMLKILEKQRCSLDVESINLDGKVYVDIIKVAERMGYTLGARQNAKCRM